MLTPINTLLNDNEIQWITVIQYFITIALGDLWTEIVANKQWAVHVVCFYTQKEEDEVKKNGVLWWLSEIM